jgi:hypothetical protein
VAIKNSYEARVFIKEARDAIRLHKREMPERRTWRGKGTEKRAGTGTDK